ncbi:MAG: GH3 auxin-responsive promoter family protein [Myxococcaceae bacterium]|nr:GH3 auxin-responsive promoter family protein [Myxococcaceae bacterium]
MRERLNEALLGLIALLFRAFAWVLEQRLRMRLEGFREAQRALRAELEVRDETPVATFAELGPSLERARVRHGRRAVEVTTSGSTSAAKRLVYTRGRLILTRFLFIDVFARLMRAARCRRWSLFVLAPRGDDDSLSSALNRETRAPTYPEALEGPYRVMRDAAFAEACARHGETAARAWLLAVSNPGFLYATNPSTLAVFFESLGPEWSRVSALAAAFLRGEEPGLARLFRQTATLGARARLERMAGSAAPLAVTELAPGLEVFACWDGGYVRPFLERARRHLPESKVRFLPMYSMSTEVVETLGVAVGEGAAFDVAYLPCAPGVLYEFAPEGDGPPRLLSPWELEPGKSYGLVVSDRFGLTRYQTDDVFECRRLVDGHPDLRFLRRRGLSYSFTGEKLTAEHLTAAYALARARLGVGSDDTHWCAFPTLGRDGATPGYRLIRVGQAKGPATAEVARAVDEALAEVNGEYRQKRQTGRLAPLEGLELDVQRFVAAVAGPSAVGTWENQFKFLPLSPRLWDEGVR